MSRRGNVVTRLRFFFFSSGGAGGGEGERLGKQCQKTILPSEARKGNVSNKSGKIIARPDAKKESYCSVKLPKPVSYPLKKIPIYQFGAAFPVWSPEFSRLRVGSVQYALKKKKRS